MGFANACAYLNGKIDDGKKNGKVQCKWHARKRKNRPHSVLEQFWRREAVISVQRRGARWKVLGGRAAFPFLVASADRRWSHPAKYRLVCHVLDSYSNRFGWRIVLAIVLNRSLAETRRYCRLTQSTDTPTLHLPVFVCKLRVSCSFLMLHFYYPHVFPNNHIV